MPELPKLKKQGKTSALPRSTSRVVSDRDMNLTTSVIKVTYAAGNTRGLAVNAAAREDTINRRLRSEVGLRLEVMHTSPLCRVLNALPPILENDTGARYHFACRNFGIIDAPTFHGISDAIFPYIKVWRLRRLTAIPT